VLLATLGLEIKVVDLTGLPFLKTIKKDTVVKVSNFMKYLILLVLCGDAYANDDEKEPRVVYKEKTEIDFESVEVSGELVRPQGALLLDRKRAQFNSMIKLRTDFDDLMEDTVEEIK
tara:strand:- start:69 stop:419 length:351 start_codon:yes stop_codon:yes gene_type:complete